MNCDSIVARGFTPWQPSAQAVDVDVFHVHDIPLIGTFRLGDAAVLFACLTGATSEVNVWAYLHVSEVEADTFASGDFESTDELEQAVHDLFPGRRAAFAIAHNGMITEWSADDVPADETLLDAAIRFMERSLQATKSNRHKAAQARADVTRKTLVPA